MGYAKKSNVFLLPFILVAISFFYVTACSAQELSPEKELRNYFTSLGEANFEKSVVFFHPEYLAKFKNYAKNLVIKSEVEVRDKILQGYGVSTLKELENTTAENLYISRMSKHWGLDNEEKRKRYLQLTKGTQHDIMETREVDNSTSRLTVSTLVQIDGRVSTSEQIYTMIRTATSWKIFDIAKE